jgi:MFS family permease
MLTLTLLGNTSKRYGAARTNQIGHAFIASGILILLIPWLPFLIVGSLIIGLGYGMITPSASHLLMRYTLPHRRSTVFSIHQIGIPAGGILASSIAPAITVYTSWHWAVLFSASLLVCVVLLMQVRRHHWDDDRDQSAAIITTNPFAGTQAIWAHPKLRLATLAGSCFSWVQFCTATFTVVACVSVLQMDLLIAGTVLSVVQLSSAAGRVLMGWIVDRINNTIIVLGFNAAILIIATIATLFLTPELLIFEELFCLATEDPLY